jgi:hypothetical protein
MWGLVGGGRAAIWLRNTSLNGWMKEAVKRVTPTDATTEHYSNPAFYTPTKTV